MATTRREPTLVVTAGMQASGSTWIFNVARMLLEAANTPFNICATESGVAVLDAIHRQTPYTLVKAHGFDLRFLNLVDLARSRFIMSSRDPRDSAVSQMERFDASLGDAVGDLSRALSSFEMLPPQLTRLDFSYERRFMDVPETIGEIAGFLGVPASDDDVAAIHAALRPEIVKRQIATHAGIASRAVDQDSRTQWNRGHLGDGRVGKWRDRLSRDHARAVEDALAPLADNGRWRSEPIRWSGELFRYDREVTSGGTKQIRCDGAERVLVYGPYLHLPAGRWLARLEISVTGDGRCDGVSADVHMPMYGNQAARVDLPARASDETTVEMTFDHRDHFESIELRLLTSSGSRGTLEFSGAVLHWLGPI